MIDDDKTTISRPTYVHHQWIIGVGLGLAAFGLYILTLAPTVLAADSGEFQFVPWLPGITHPTGYPLYTLLGWLWTHVLPIGEVAWRMNLLSAVCAAIAVGLTYAVARRLVDNSLPGTPRLARGLAATTAAATFAVSHTFWSQAIVAEVYALHAILVALIIWLALKLQATGGDLFSWPAKLLTFTFGLSLAHHLTTLLLLPALTLFLFLSVKRQARPPKNPSDDTLRLVLMHGSLFVLPLLLYLYLPLIAPVTPYATLTLSDQQTLTLYDNSLAGFWDHVTATVFTPDVQPAALDVDRIRFTGQLLRQQVGWPGIVFAVAGLVTLWQQRRLDFLILTGLASLTFVCFNLIYFIGDVYVLFIPVWFFVCLWLGIGTLGLAHWLARNFVQRKTGSPATSMTFGNIEQHLGQGIYQLLVVGLVMVGLLLTVLPPLIGNVTVSQGHNTVARQRWLEILAEPIPSGAVLLSNDRNEIMPLWYFQYVDGRRPDLFGLFPLIVTDPAYANVGRLLDQALTSGRPVYLIKPMAGLSLKANLSPAGTLYRATTHHAPPDYPHEVILPAAEVQNKAESVKFLGYDLSAEKVLPGDEISIVLHWQAVQELSTDFTSYVHLINSAGRGITQSDHQPGGDFYPSSYWQPGEILRDHHTLSIPVDVPAGEYRLHAGMYYQPEPGLIVGMGGGEDIGQIVVASE